MVLWDRLRRIMQRCPERTIFLGVFYIANATFVCFLGTSSLKADTNCQRNNVFLKTNCNWWNMSYIVLHGRPLLVLVSKPRGWLWLTLGDSLSFPVQVEGWWTAQPFPRPLTLVVWQTAVGNVSIRFHQESLWLLTSPKQHMHAHAQHRGPFWFNFDNICSHKELTDGVRQSPKKEAVGDQLATAVSSNSTKNMRNIEKP